MRPVTATYRLQLHAGFGFAEAAAAVPYLAALGVSHLYLSPVTTAAPGSTHGYDGVDPEHLSPELGGEDGFAALVACARAAGLGLVLDIVPNHLSTASRTNRWWWDVLAFGPTARYARYFDVDWRAPEERLRDRLVLPVLGDHYGRALENGAIVLVRDDEDLVVVSVHDGTLVVPLAPASLGGLVARAAGAVGDATLAFLGRSLARLGPGRAGDDDRRPEVGAQEDAEARWADARTAVRAAVAACAPGTAAGSALDDVVARTNADVDALDDVIDAQHYRLSRWTVALDESGYRRFFDVNTLVGLRVDDPDVFAAAHARALALVRADQVDGLRVDHVDGLAQPTTYTRRLRAAAADRWVVVEKILAHDEALRPSWPVDGTTGYDFAALTTPLLVDPRGEQDLTAAYQRITGDLHSWEDHAEDSKRLVLDSVLAGDVARLADLFVRVCERRRNHRDVTRREARRAVTAVIAVMPCYRTYGEVGDDGARHVDDEDRRVLRTAFDEARRREPGIDGAVFDLLHAVVGFVASGEQETELAVRFQQLTGPARAKGEEDTALYRACRLLALNDVGHDPGRFSVTPDDFHAWCRRTAVEHPATMLTTSTHDTKRSEDVRARLAVLSEMPTRWARFMDDLLAAWPDAVDAGGDGPLDPAMAWFTAQTVVGSWPIDADRLRAVLHKSMREAKRATSWLQPDEAYEATVHRYGAALVTDTRLATMMAGMAAEITPAGRANSLALVTLRCTAPGVPDTYQGTERWDLSLVDPDNRRPVDVEANADALRHLADARPASRWSDGSGADDGTAKLAWLAALLSLRARRPQSFVGGSYEPLAVRDLEPTGATAFMRGGDVVVVVPRFFASGPAPRAATRVELPAGRWRDLASGGPVDGGSRTVEELTPTFPVAVLERA